jgi:preprotein translocase subunit SecG
MGNQFMGVKQTTDVLEKGTWMFAAIIGLLCVTSVLFMGDVKTSSAIDRVNGGATPGQTAPKTAPAPANTVPAKADSNAK